MLDGRDGYKHPAPMERTSQIASHVYRIVSQRLGIPSIDAPHVIQLLAEAKLMAAAKPHLDQMRQRGYGIPQAVYEQILRDVGEG
jgi:predicted nucleic acid-binding protein